MDAFNYSPKMLMRLSNDRVFASAPFVLIDIGCAMGINPVWRSFGDDLHAHAFDPQEDECSRLQAEEKNRHVHYHAAFVGLPDGHAFHQGGGFQKCLTASSFSLPALFDRSSSCLAGSRKQARTAAKPALPVETTEQWWRTGRLSACTTSISDFASEQNITSIDFVKIDTDGRDLEAAASCRDVIRQTNILGFMIECFFVGSDDPRENSFHNVDAFMRSNGFALYALTVNKYSRAALPAPFVYPALYQTISGQPLWGDMVYLRDAAAHDYAAVWGGDELSPTKLLKLACLYELFHLEDCAAELLVRYRDRIQDLIEPTILLDALTPPLGGVARSYREYVTLFEENPEAFFPSS